MKLLAIGVAFGVSGIFGGTFIYGMTGLHRKGQASTGLVTCVYVACIALAWALTYLSTS